MSEHTSPLGRNLAVYALYLLVAVVITWPLATHLASRYAGFGYSDAYEMAHHIWWFKHALQTGQPLFYQTLLGYPNGIEGITLWAHPLQFFPAWLFAFVLPLAAASNLTLLLTMALNGWAMYRLALDLTENRYGPSLLAGVVFMAFPTMQGHLAAGHAGLMVQWPLPLFALALLRLRATGTRRWLAATALLFVVNTWGHTLQAVYALMPLLGVYALMLLARREWRALGQTVLAVVLGAVALGVFLLPVVQETLNTAAYTDEGGAVRYSADLLAVVTPSFFHPLFGQAEYTRRVLGINIDEGLAYVGLVALALGAVAVARFRRARWWLGLALVAWLLSLGPLLKVFDQPVSVTLDTNYQTYITLPWAALESLPLFNLARTPGRFNFALALAVAALAALGAAWLWDRLRGRALRWGVMALLALTVLYEYQSFWPLPTVPAVVPDEVAALRNRDDIRAVFNAPWDNLVAAKEAIFLQTGHEQALIAGQVTRQTPVSPAKLNLLQATFDAALLEQAGADVVIIHREHDPGGALEALARAHLGEPLAAGERYAVFETRAGSSLPTLTVVPTTAEHITDRADSYLYTAAPGWTLLHADVQANGRRLAVYLNGVRVHEQQIDGTAAVDVPLALLPGYHTVTLAVEPACPQGFNPALRCRAITLSGLSFSDLLPDPLDRPVTFDRGVTLLGATLPEPQPEDSLPVWLRWRFEEPRADIDIRFVHVLNEAGELVAQSDVTLGAVAAGEGRAEQVRMNLPDDLPPGTYHVYAGWYTYPDFNRFAVLTEVEGAQDNLALVGTFERP